MPKEWIPHGRKIIDNYAREDIIYSMSSWENEAQKTLADMEYRHKAGWTAAGAAILMAAIASLFLYLKGGRKPKSKITKEGIMKLPDRGDAPVVLSRLYNSGALGKEALLATLLQLIKRGYLTIGYDGSESGSLSMGADIVKGGLLPHEEYLLNWLIKDMGNGRHLSLKDTAKLFSASKSDRRFQYKFSTWSRLSEQKTGGQKEKAKLLKVVLLGLIISVMCMACAFIAGMLYRNYPAALAAAAASLLLAAYAGFYKDKNPSAYEKLEQWEQFKVFLKKCLEDREVSLPIDRWEQYLIYALPLHMAPAVFKGLVAKYPRYRFEDDGLTFLHISHHDWIDELLNVISRRPMHRK